MESIKSDISRLEQKVDEGFNRLDNKIDGFLFMVSKRDLDEADKGALVQTRILILENDLEERTKQKGFWQNKIVDYSMKGIIAVVLVLLGFKDSISKVFGF